MKQTAVEWLEDRYRPKGYITAEEFNQAKEMEKQQIMDAYKSGNHTETRGGKVIFEKMEQYYNETYGGNKQECQFEPNSNLTSATKCKWCGQEKWQHKTYGGKK